MGSQESISGDSEHKAEDTFSNTLQVTHTHTSIHTLWTNLEMPVSLQHRSLDWGIKPKNPEGPKNMGRESNPQPWIN